MPFHRENHYVPRLYLKRFARRDGRIATYRILVADHRVPEWKMSSTKGVAYHSHLYTRIAGGFETDEVELWLKREFEDPAEEAIKRATAGIRLAPTDWRNLVRFLAAQDVRTPVRLAENLKHGRENMPTILQDSLEKLVREYELAKRSGKPMMAPKAPYSEYIPLRVTSELEPGQAFGKVKAEVIAGRGFWLFSIRHLLTKTASVLHEHKWSLLKPPDGLAWLTSDNPVLRLNYYPDGTYDFNGGWGNPGTEILLPLDPYHLLYTKVGERPPRRGSIVPRAEAQKIRRCIAEHAHRFIFASLIDAEVPKLHPRTVDADILRRENEQWRKWHEEQTNAERELMGSHDSTSS